MFGVRSAFEETLGGLFIPQTHETHANNLKVSVNFDNLILTQTYFFAFRCASLS